MEKDEKCWLHHCICFESSRMPTARGEICCIGSQADSRKGLISSSSQEPSAPGKPAAGNEEPGKPTQEFCFQKKLTRQIWEDLIMKAQKVMCSVRQGLNLRDRNIKLDLSIIASVRQSNMLMVKDWNYRTHNTDILNLDENKFVHKRNYLMKEKVLRDARIRNMHEMGEMKRSEELRVDEVSVPKFRKKIMRQYKSSLRSCRKCKNR